MKSFPLPLILGHEFEFFTYWKHELLDQPWFKNVLEILDLFGLKIAIFNESQVQFFFFWGDYFKTCVLLIYYYLILHVKMGPLGY